MTNTTLLPYRRIMSALRQSRGFTLIELLVVVAVIALLIGLLLPALASAQESARRVVCLANLRSVSQAAFVYANDSPVEAFIPTLGPGNDDIAYLWSRYHASPEAAVCPSTENYVDPTLLFSSDNLDALGEYDTGGGVLADRAARVALAKNHGRPVPVHLMQLAIDKTDDGTNSNNSIGGGHSYEVDAWMNEGIYPRFGRVAGSAARNRQRGYDGNDSSLLLNRFTTADGPALLKTAPRVQAPSLNRILGDADSGQDTTSINNYPDESDNHGADGLNAGFCDGSARWIRQPEVVRVYLASGRTVRAIQEGGRELWQELEPGLRVRQTTIHTPEGPRLADEWFFNE